MVAPMSASSRSIRGCRCSAARRWRTWMPSKPARQHPGDVFADIRMADLLMTAAEAKAGAAGARKPGCASVSLQPIIFPTVHQDGLKVVRKYSAILVDRRTPLVGTQPKASQSRSFRPTAAGRPSGPPWPDRRLNVILDAWRGEGLKKWTTGIMPSDPASARACASNGKVALSTQDRGERTSSWIDAPGSRPCAHPGRPDWEIPSGAVSERARWRALPTINYYVNKTNTWGEMQAVRRRRCPEREWRNGRRDAYAIQVILGLQGTSSTGWHRHPALPR